MEQADPLHLPEDVVAVVPHGAVRSQADRHAGMHHLGNGGNAVGVAAVEDDGVDFAERMTEIHQELLKLQAESNELMQTISKNLEAMGL